MAKPGKLPLLSSLLRLFRRKAPPLDRKPEPHQVLIDLVGDENCSAPKNLKGLVEFDVDFSTLLRRYTGQSRVLVLEQDENEDEIRDRLLAGEGSLNLVLFNRSRVPPSRHGVMNLTRRDFEELQYIAASSTQTRKRVQLLKFVSARFAESINPFQTQREARGLMFFDRHDELNELQNGGMCQAIIGARRIGKSSLVWKFTETISGDHRRHVSIPGYPDPILPLARIVCLDVGAEHLWAEAYDIIGQRIYDRALGRRHALTDPVKRQYRRLDAYESFRKLTSEVYKGAVLVLDEIDSLIEADSRNSWRLFRQIKGWVQSTRGSIVFCGYKQLSRALRDDTFPFFQTCDVVRLSNIPIADAKQLVADPLSDLDITLDNKRVELICHIAGSTPYQIQGLCRRIADHWPPPRGKSFVYVSDMVRRTPEITNTVESFDEMPPMSKAVLFIAVMHMCKSVLQHTQREDFPDGHDWAVRFIDRYGEDLARYRIDARQTRAAILDKLGDEAPADYDRIFSEALEDLVMRNIFAQEIALISYRFVGAYLVGHLALEYVQRTLDERLALTLAGWKRS